MDALANPGDLTPSGGTGYKKIQRLGRGSFGEVWRGEGPGGVEVAIKVISRPLDHQEAHRELGSLELIRQLHHPYLLQTQAYWIKDGHLHIAMELADCNLCDRANQYKREGLPGIPLPELLRYLGQAAEALDYLHSKGVYDRDIKPENILLFSGNAKLDPLSPAVQHVLLKALSKELLLERFGSCLEFDEALEQEFPPELHPAKESGVRAPPMVSESTVSGEMSAVEPRHSGQSGDSVSPALLQRIHQVCDRFEDACKAGQRPRIEAYLVDVPEPERSRLLRKLLALELQHRCRSGETLAMEDYVERFPEHADLIQPIFEKAWIHPRNPRASSRAWAFFLRVGKAVRGIFSRPSEERTASLPPIPSHEVVDGPVAPVDALLQNMRLLSLLGSQQLKEAERELRSSCATTEDLLAELHRRGWLTGYQAEEAAAGRTSELVLERYVLLERLGEGGMGQVFKARHRVQQRVVALKVIKRERIADTKAVERFRREIRLAAQLEHPHVVRSYDANEDQGRLFFVMEYLHGFDLNRLVHERHSLPFAQACDFIRQAAVALQYIHERGLIHRDIKPSNLFRTEPEGIVKVLDLGLAKLLERESSDQSYTELTPTGIWMGTPDYMAPEQAGSARSVDLRADLYSLGCTFYFLLAGRPPFPGGNPLQKLIKHMNEDPIPVEELRPEALHEVGDIIRRMMAKRPEDRPASAAEVAALLQPYTSA